MSENNQKSLIDGKPATRRHIFLFDEDYEFIKQTYGEYPGISAAIRLIVHERVIRAQRKAMERAQAQAISTDGLEEMLEPEAKL